MNYDFVSIGSATVDHFADTDSELIKIQTRTTSEELIAFPLGSKLLIEELNITTGGGGTNSAVTLAKLGLHTAFLGKLGSDTNSEFILRALSENDVDFIGSCDGQTGLSFILNSITDDRSILAFKGANNYLTVNDIEPFETQWVYLSSMLGESFDTVVELLKGQRCKVAFNPSNYQAEEGIEKLEVLIDLVDVLILNKEEAAKFLGVHYNESLAIDGLMKELSKLSPSLFVISDGSRGIYVYDGEYFYHGHPNTSVNVVETTGAGDALGATFVAAQFWGLPQESAIHMAMTNAESVIQQKGSKENLLDRKELELKMTLFDRTIEKRRQM